MQSNRRFTPKPVKYALDFYHMAQAGALTGDEQYEAPQFNEEGTKTKEARLATTGTKTLMHRAIGRLTQRQFRSYLAQTGVRA